MKGLGIKPRWQQEHPENILLNNARARAKRFGLPFSITVENISIPEVCPVLGIPISVGGSRSANSPSLDRIKPELGYVPGNVMVISDRANRIKTDATAEEIYAVASWLQGLLNT